jgi:alpha-galactosidase
MGWNSWNKFGCNVSEQLIREVADSIVSSGMRDAGYRYVVIDDCWQISRNAEGTIQADPQRFPSGIKALADYVHSRGLKFGLYSAAGDRTCQGRPGGRGHEAQDARTYAAWGVDYLKYDWCSFEKMDAPAAYKTMRDALAATGRPILFSICEWGMSDPAKWAPAVGNMWRTAGDITDAFDKAGSSFPPAPGAGGAVPPMPPPGGGPAGPPPTLPADVKIPPMGLGVLQVIDRQAGLGHYAGPGGWNDPDMLEVGNGGMTADEYRAHQALWAIMGSPLIAGNDVRKMDAETRAILTNAEVIAVSQDPLGKAGDRIKKDGDADIWGRPLAGGAMAVALLNRGAAPITITLDAQTLGLQAASLTLRDLWEGKTLGALGKSRSFTVAGRSALMLRVAPKT